MNEYSPWPLGVRIKIAVPLWEGLPDLWSALVELTGARLEDDGTWLLTVTKVAETEGMER